MSRSPHYMRVERMMLGFGQATPQTPQIPDENTRRLRCRLLLEEAFEFVEACGFRAELRGATVHPEEMSLVEVDSVIDLIEMADAMADVSVVNTGSMVACGIHDNELLEEVDANNLLKVATGRLSPGGKFIKSPDHPKPNIGDVVWRQRNTRV